MAEWNPEKYNLSILSEAVYSHLVCWKIIMNNVTKSIINEINAT